MPTISLIISTYNNPLALGEILRRIECGTELPEQVLISDDGSGEETRALVDQWIRESKLNIVHCWHEDKGFRKTRILNITLSRTTGEYVVYLDGDCLPMPCFIEDHRKLAEKGYFVQGRRAFVSEEAVQGLLRHEVSFFSLFLHRKIRGLVKSFRFPVPVVIRNRRHKGLIGCNLAIWTEDLVAVNGYDEAYEGWGIGEDSDLCIRLYNKGLRRKFVYGRAIIFHLDHPPCSKDHVKKSLARLQEAIDSKRVRCENGLDQCLETD
ncbi:glycosyltransferase [Pontiella sp.]|uniref:glycosyltransferase n=1 Tax=Pontiella sp. TaxID=2837462 RepID=UPI00356B1AA0